MNKRTLSRVALSVCTVLFLMGIISWGYMRLSFREKQAEVDLYALVTADCEAVLEVHDIHALHRDVRLSDFAPVCKELRVSSLLDFLTRHLDALSTQQAHGLSAEMSRLLVSFHRPGTEHDQVVYGRVGSGDRAFVEQVMEQANSTLFPPKTLIYKGETLTVYPLGRDFLVCYFQPGFFAISYQKELIERVVDACKGQNSSVCADKSFRALREGRKRSDALALYLRGEGQREEEGKESRPRWSLFDIRINPGAIYLTGGQAVPQDTLCLPGEGEVQAFYEGNLLVASEVEALRSYPVEEADAERISPTVLEKLPLYRRCLDDLAEQADFTLLADLDGVIRAERQSGQDAAAEGSSAEECPWDVVLPPFFFEQGDFFRHFMLSVQCIRAGEGRMSVNVVLRPTP